MRRKDNLQPLFTPRGTRVTPMSEGENCSSDAKIEDVIEEQKEYDDDELDR